MSHQQQPQAEKGEQGPPGEPGPKVMFKGTSVVSKYAITTQILFSF